ncbi:MAG TPA: PLP-dependent aminotransferase family protein [Bryobacteraceae bacterium]|nr:PLP-dependent aminotransferase family protein [Bryobacteraceae bacterium]
MVPEIHIVSPSEVPYYRQVYEQIRVAILSGRMARGERLPPTRELAGSIGLNRTTITAAYELLENDGLIKSHVGRGSFVEWANRVDWESIIAADENPPAAPSALISFSASRPSEMQFPLEEFRATCREVIDSKDAANILQLGPASGYEPLRRFILEQLRSRGEAGENDDILITSGCQQAFDLIQRVLAPRGETVVLEDPVYPGVRSVFQRGGARVIGAPVTLRGARSGVEVDSLERIFEKEHPRLVVLTPNFQNPTGTTIPEDARKQIFELARRFGVIIVEDDLYGGLRYFGEDVRAMKALDEADDVILLGSFSKIAFPGLRVGWCVGPKHFIARLSEAKEASDLHSDQLSQAVLLRFAETGRLAAHRKKMLAAGAERLRACIQSCEKELPEGSEFTRPEGGMNLWVRLPEPLDAAELAARAARENVSFTPGKYFAVSRPQAHGLRLCFAAMTPENIRYGLQVLGVIFRTEFARARKQRREPVPVLV